MVILWPAIMATTFSSAGGVFGEAARVGAAASGVGCELLAAAVAVSPPPRMPDRTTRAMACPGVFMMRAYAAGVLFNIDTIPDPENHHGTTWPVREQGKCEESVFGSPRAARMGLERGGICVGLPLWANLTCVWGVGGSGGGSELNSVPGAPAIQQGSDTLFGG